MAARLTPPRATAACSNAPKTTSRGQTAQTWFTGDKPGDETSRFPRSYAVNKNAGVNETNKNGLARMVARFADTQPKPR